MMDLEETTNLGEQIDNLQIQMLSHDGYAPEFTQMVANLNVLYQLKIKDDENDIRRVEINNEYEVKLKQIQLSISEIENKNRIDINSLISSGAGLLGIFSILSFEKAHVLTTKALGFVRRM